MQTDKPHGVIWWSELMTRDIAGVSKFYGELIGWSPQVMSMSNPMTPAEPGEPGYTVFMNGDQPAGGAMDMAMIDEEGIPAHWFTHIAVRDVDAAVARVAELGGKVVKEPFDISKVGRIAIIEDPGGATVGLITPQLPSQQASQGAA